MKINYFKSFSVVIIFLFIFLALPQISLANICDFQVPLSTPQFPCGSRYEAMNTYCSSIPAGQTCCNINGVPTITSDLSCPVADDLTPFSGQCAVPPAGQICCCTEAVSTTTPLATTTDDQNSQNNSGGVFMANPLGASTTVQMLVGRIINAVLGLIGTLALVMFVFGGFLWMTAAGNEKQVAKGQKILLWSALGLVIIFTSYALVRFLLSDIIGV